MALPILFIGAAAAASGLFGAGKTIQAGVDTFSANEINRNANQMVDDASVRLNEQKQACGNALSRLGEEKLFILNGNMTAFLDTFSKIKNVDFRDSLGLEELSKLHIDQKEFSEMKEMVNFAGSLAGGAAVGTAGGALVAFGAYGAAQALACASTGTAISALSGAAATNATLAFFGGGSLAAGGLGMAGGTMVLGSLVAGPALLAMGMIAGAAAAKNLEQAQINQQEAIQISEQLSTASEQCAAIRRRTHMFYNLLARLDSYFLPLIYRMEDIVADMGNDYSTYNPEAKKCIASCASFAVSVKGVLDTPILTDDGLLTEESGERVDTVREFIDSVMFREK